MAYIVAIRWGSSNFFMLRSSVNKAVLFIVVIISAVFFFKYGIHPRNPTFSSDAFTYYRYLPAIFIYNNDIMAELPIDKGIDTGIVMSSKKVQDWQAPQTGKVVNPYTYGVAFMEMPFFFIAHTIEKIRNAPANGYSATYDYLIKTAELFYALMGLILVYKILKNYFTPTQSFLGVIAIFSGTNLFWFTLIQGGMSHVPLFFLYALLIYLVIELHKQPKTVTFFATGFIAGLITIIRPSDILCLLIPLLYNVYNKETVLQKIEFIKENLFKMVCFALAFFIPIIPQLIYWKAVSGSYLYYSYGRQSFNWLHPRIIEGLFYFSNGWLPYSPVMIFSIAGFALFGRYKKWAWCTWVIFLLYIYIIYSWYCYNYINGYGSRPMIHLYPLLALPLTAFIQFISGKRFFVRAFIGVLCVFFISLNIGFCRLQATGMLKSEESNIAYNFQVFFRNHLTYNDLVVCDVKERQPEHNKLTKLQTLACENYNDSLSDHFVKDTILNSGYFYQMENDQYSPDLSVAYNNEQFKDAKWLKCCGKFMYPQKPGNSMHLLVLDIPGKLWRSCRIENKINDSLKNYSLDHSETNKWGYVYFYIRIPENMKSGDVIKLYVWNFPQTELFVDDLCLELYE